MYVSNQILQPWRKMGAKWSNICCVDKHELVYSVDKHYYQLYDTSIRKYIIPSIQRIILDFGQEIDLQAVFYQNFLAHWVYTGISVEYILVTPLTVQLIIKIGK